MKAFLNRLYRHRHMDKGGFRKNVLTGPPVQTKGLVNLPDFLPNLADFSDIRVLNFSCKDPLRDTSCINILTQLELILGRDTIE